MRFLLDTNVVSDLVRNPQGKCAARVAQAGESNICTSIIVACELRYGALKKASIRLTRQLEKVLSVLDIVPFEAPADSVYAKVRTKLEAAGGNSCCPQKRLLCVSFVSVVISIPAVRRSPASPHSRNPDVIHISNIPSRIEHQWASNRLLFSLWLTARYCHLSIALPASGGRTSNCRS